MTAPSDAAAASDGERPSCAGLSTDYLNRYSEVLMLIEMATEAPDLADALRSWKAIDYRSYFAASGLRLASVALAAYEALPAERRLAFEKLVRAMDELAAMAVLALDLRDDPDTAAFVPVVTAPDHAPPDRPGDELPQQRRRRDRRRCRRRGSKPRSTG